MTPEFIAASACSESAKATFDPDFDAGPAPSPCVDICQLDAQRQGCVGCGRSLVEIGAWRHMAEADKRAVWRRLRARREAAEP